MNLVQELTDYLAPVTTTMTPCLGLWDESPGEADTEFLSINLAPSPQPGVISLFEHVDLWIVSARDQQDREGGRMAAYSKASAVRQYILANPSSSCFVNVKSITGIIGPMVSEEMRDIYKVTIEITIKGGP